MSVSSDIRHMEHALRLARRGLGRTWPNPSVGALIIKENSVLGAATTAPSGRPHAETQVLAQVGAHSQGATLYVTLEPCAHQGKTPPCTDAIIAAGIKRVVVGCMDPNPLVAGKGIAKLRTAGIEVTENICTNDARAVGEGFLCVIEKGRPFITLKVATSLDGKIATADGESKWITGEASRRKVHALRGCHDALLTGIGTVLYDDPQLNCRLPGCESDSPQRVVMDGNLRMPHGAKALPAWLFTSPQAVKTQKDKVRMLEEKGVSIFTVEQMAAKLSLHATLTILAEKGITRVLVEAGSALASEFMRHNLVDRLYWFRAPIIIGDGGIPAIEGHDAPLADLSRLSLQGTERFGGDILEIYDSPNH